MSTERLIVDKRVLSQFSSKLAQVVSSIPVHPGASAAGTTKVAKLVSDAVSQGATLLGNGKFEQRGSLLTPQILSNTTTDMDIWHQETFGPVAVLIGFDSIQEAIGLANDSAYGLSASVFTADISKALSMAKKLESGAVHINSTTVHDEAHAPHGGAKGSGWGRFGVPWGRIT